MNDRVVKVRESKLVRRILEAITRVASVLAEMAGQIFDLHLAFTRHWAARFRRRFINADLGVFSLCEELDFVQFCRDLKKPIAPELQAWREEDLLFEGFESGRNFFIDDEHGYRRSTLRSPPDCMVDIGQRRAACH